MFKKITNAIFILSLACLFSFPVAVMADNCTVDAQGNPTATFCNPIKDNTIGDLAVTLTQFFIGAMSGVAVLVIVISGFKMIVANGNEEQIKGARSAITWALIGLIISLLAYSFVAIISTLLLKSSNTAAIPPGK